MRYPLSLGRIVLLFALFMSLTTITSAATITGSASGWLARDLPPETCSYSAGLNQSGSCSLPSTPSNRIVNIARSFDYADPYTTSLEAYAKGDCADPACVTMPIARSTNAGNAYASVSVSGDYRFFGGPVGQTGTISIDVQCSESLDAASGYTILTFDGQTFGNFVDCNTAIYTFPVVYGDVYWFSYEAFAHGVTGGGNGGGTDITSQFDPSDGALALPEPSNMVLLGTGLVALRGLLRRRVGLP